MLSDPSHKNTKPKKPGYQANRDEYRNSDEFLRYEALCRGEDTQVIGLKCSEEKNIIHS